MSCSPNEDHFSKWQNVHGNTTQYSSEGVLLCFVLFFCGKCNFSYNTVKLFFLSSFVSSTASHLGKPMTELFFISILSFPNLSWSSPHRLIWYAVLFHHHFICLSADCFSDTLPSSNTCSDCYPVSCWNKTRVFIFVSQMCILNAYCTPALEVSTH